MRIARGREGEHTYKQVGEAVYVRAPRSLKQQKKQRTSKTTVVMTHGRGRRLVLLLPHLNPHDTIGDGSRYHL